MTILDSYVDTLNFLKNSINIPILKDLSGYDFRKNHPRINYSTRYNLGMLNNPIQVYMHDSEKESFYMIYLNGFLTIFKNLKKESIEIIIEQYKKNSDLEFLFEVSECFDYAASYRVKFNNDVPKFSLVYFSNKNLRLKVTKNNSIGGENYHFIFSRKGVNSNLNYKHSIIFPTTKFLNKNFVMNKFDLVKHFNWTSISNDSEKIVQLIYGTTDLRVDYNKKEKFYPYSYTYKKDRSDGDFYYINPRVIQFMKDNEIKNPIAHFKGDKNKEEWDLLELMVGE